MKLKGGFNMWGKALMVILAILFSKWLGLLIFILFAFSIDGEITLIKYRKYKDELETTDDPKQTPDWFEIYKNHAIELYGDIYGDIYRIKDLENHYDFGFDYKTIDQAKKAVDNI